MTEKRNNNIISFLIIVLALCMLAAALFFKGFAFLPAVSADAAGSKISLRVLEIQPGTKYELFQSKLQEKFGSKYELELVQMPMKAFIGKIEEINGYYDIIYIGNRTYEEDFKNTHYLGSSPTPGSLANFDTQDSGGVKINIAKNNLNASKEMVKYYAIGYSNFEYIPLHYKKSGSNNYTEIYTNPTNNLQMNGFTYSVKESFSPNDITNLKAQKLIDYIKSGQMTIFASSIFDTVNDSSIKQTVIYKKFIEFKNSGKYDNFKLISNIADSVYTDISTWYLTAAKRPLLKLTGKPLQYNGNQSSYMQERMMKYRFDILPSDGNADPTQRFNALLYIDINGDGLFKKDEIVEKLNDLQYGQGYSINYRIVDTFTGMLQWKLEIENASSCIKTYETGEAAFRGNPLKIRVLQLVPDKNTFSIKDMSKTMLLKEGEYIIEVTEMHVNHFDSNYPNYVDGKPTNLDNYDMIIFGFADSYGNSGLSDIRRPQALEAVKKFIVTGQSVMFTHDTISFRQNQDNVSSSISRNFRQLAGQNIYDEDASNFDLSKPYTPSDAVKLPMPFYTQSSKNISFGFTRMLLDRANNGWTSNKPNKMGAFPTTKQAVGFNKGLITMYPFKLDILPTINIAETHAQWFQLDLNDEDVVPWYTLYDEQGYRFDEEDPRNNYYTYSKGSITYSGTGHSSPKNVEDENKLFVNTIIKASRGSNHAPELQIKDLTDGQNIPKSKEYFTFSFVASDPDFPRDSSLIASIKLNYNGNDHQVKDIEVDGQTISDNEFNVECLKQVNVKIPKKSGSFFNLPDDVEQFKVIVEARDSRNAKGFAQVSLFHKDEPSLDVQIQKENGYLAGDTANVSIKIKPHNYVNADIRIQNIIIKIKPVNESKNYYGINYVNYDANSGIKHTIINTNKEVILEVPDFISYLTGGANWNEICANASLHIKGIGQDIQKLDFVCEVSYEYRVGTSGPFIPGNIDQNNNAAPFILPFDIPVRNGEINVSIKDFKQRALPDMPVSLYRVNGQQTQKIIDVNTGSTGLSIIKNGSNFSLASGKYRIRAVVPESYKAVDANGNEVQDSVDIDLTYDSYISNIAFIFKGEALANVEIMSISSNVSLKKEVSGIQGSRTTQKLMFEVKREIKNMEFTLNTDINNAFFSTYVLNKYSADGSKQRISNPSSTASGSSILISGSLPEGKYEIVFNMSIPKNIQQRLKSNNMFYILRVGNIEYIDTALRDDRIKDRYEGDAGLLKVYVSKPPKYR